MEKVLSVSGEGPWALGGDATSFCRGGLGPAPHDTLPHSPGLQVLHPGIGLQCGWEVTDLFPFYSPTQESGEQAPDTATLPCPRTVWWGCLC